MNFSSKMRKINSLMMVVDDKSKLIIAYLFRERYAEVKKLADLICASSDMEVLMRIREVINPKAQEIIGEPLITFEHSKVDPLTGEKIMFSWWLREEFTDGLCGDKLLDIFDEKNVLRIITSLPLHEENVEVEVKDNFLIISGNEYHVEVPLFCPVEKKVSRTVNNGVLEIKLKKVE